MDVVARLYWFHVQSAVSLFLLFMHHPGAKADENACRIKNIYVNLGLSTLEKNVGERNK